MSERKLSKSEGLDDSRMSNYNNSAAHFWL